LPYELGDRGALDVHAGPELGDGELHQRGARVSGEDEGFTLDLVGGEGPDRGRGLEPAVRPVEDLDARPVGLVRERIGDGKEPRGELLVRQAATKTRPSTNARSVIDWLRPFLALFPRLGSAGRPWRTARSRARPPRACPSDRPGPAPVPRRDPCRARLSGKPCPRRGSPRGR